MQWPKPCEATFESLRDSNPTLLRKWCLSGRLTPAQLTFALEQLGAAGYVLVPVLMLLHPSPLVREGAVYGIDIGGKWSRIFLHLVARLDPSPGVRLAAKDSICLEY